jgi:hypothetical protein
MNIQQDKQKIILLIIAGVGLLSILLFQALLRKDKLTYRSRAEGTNTVSMKFEPAVANPGATGEFASTVQGKATANINVQGYSFGLVFDKAKVEVKTITYKLGTVSTGLGDDTSTVAEVNTRGYIKIHGEVQDAAGKPVTSAAYSDIVSIGFKSKSASPSSIVLGTTTAPQFISIGTNGVLTPVTATLETLAINGGTASITISPSISPTGPVPTGPTPTGPTTTPAVTSGSGFMLNLKLKFQGILKKPDTALSKMTVKVTALSSTNQRYEASSVFESDANGVWSGQLAFNGMTAGNGYRLFIKGPKHVQKKVCDTVPSETSPGTYKCGSNSRINLTESNMTLDFSKIVMLVGDLPQQDGIVDSYDLSLIRNNLGKKDENVVKLADVNNDGIVDTQDNSLVIAALSIRLDEVD